MVTGVGHVSPILELCSCPMEEGRPAAAATVPAADKLVGEVSSGPLSCGQRGGQLGREEGTEPGVQPGKSGAADTSCKGPGDLGHGYLLLPLPVPNRMEA